MRELETIFNPYDGQDWEDFQAHEIATDKAMEYVLAYRL